VRASRSVCVLADHTKVGIVGLSTFMQLAEVDTLITDAGMPPRARAILEESVDHLVLAEVPGTSSSGALRAVRRQGGGEEG
jgi:DeoR/GlpR family transcriptional regulator of sugar metabolism